MSHVPLPMKSVNLPPLLSDFSQDVKAKGPHSGTALGTQHFSGRLNAKFTVQSQEFLKTAKTTTEKRMIHVDLDGSEFGAPTNMKDQDDYRGFFVEWIHYKMWIQKHGESPDPAKPLKGWDILREAPNTSNQTGSVTSSISFGLDASGGVMGDMPMGTVGAHIGVSNSHTHSLKDFTFMQHSTGSVLAHEINMTMTGDGSPYKSASDLINPWQSPFVGIRLRSLPNLAKSNVPLIGQGVWMNENDAALTDKVTVHIAVTPHWLLTEGMYDGSLHHWNTAFGGTFKYKQEIDFTLLG
ncbi:hypothetical protein SAMN05444851_0836 [Aliiroseovarius sediminilitoris]|uniref:Uncharacterized protein n=2 Tax=Aliiroseovarius sediminilitoris TaxID=1173584 RepID=A0A1I0NI67_9RHOB|nr:hypothetical protein SAMN05444851_0836 [Aliiroseovarius sediminilitoris]